MPLMDLPLCLHLARAEDEAAEAEEQLDFLWFSFVGRATAGPLLKMLAYGLVAASVRPISDGVTYTRAAMPS